MLRSLAPLAFVVIAACRPEPTQEPTPAPPTTPPVDSGDDGAAESPPANEACGEAGPCTDGKTCVEYFGIAGPSGPKFFSCEIPCAGEKSSCPAGQACITIADGPGQVCRPAS